MGMEENRSYMRKNYDDEKKQNSYSSGVGSFGAYAIERGGEGMDRNIA